VTALLSDIGIAGGCLFIAAVACLVILFGLCVADDRRDGRHAGAQPNPVPGVYERDECPWCDTRTCLDSSLCNCEVPCGSWLCVVKEASHG
jgi:hypothetical protein